MKRNSVRFKIAVLLMTGSIIGLHGGTPGYVFQPQPGIPRKIEIKAEPMFPIATNGKALCEVVVPAKSAPMLKFAGKQLAFYLEKIIGGKVAVAAKPSGKKTAFILGMEGAKLAGFDLAKMDRDGYIIKTVGKNIVIAGNDDPKVNPKITYHYNERGTLNGVYEFLERFGGIRFYFPGEIGTVVPRKRDWKLPQIDIVDRPDMQYRRNYTGKKAIGVTTAFYAGMPEKEIRLFSDLQMRLSTGNLPSSHGLAYLGLVQRFAKTHPEYFALRDNGKRHDGSEISSKHDVAGQLCFSNEGLKKEIYLDARALLTGQPASSRGIIMPNGKSYWAPARHDPPFFGIAPADSLYKCRCPKCYPAFSSGNQTSSNLIWKFVADVGNKLKQDRIPGYLSMAAYSCYADVPEFDIPDNVVVKLCQTGPWNESHPADQEKTLQLLRAWKQKLPIKPFLHTYVCKTGNRGTVLNIPGFTPKAVGSFFRKVKSDVFGAFLEAGTDFWIFNFMNYYVFGKIMWDVSTDVDALLDEHCRLMYGAAAPQMKEFYDTLERHWMKDIVGRTIETPLGPQPVLPSLHEIWTKIYSPDELNRINRLFDKAEKIVSNDPDALKRVNFMRREMFGPIVAGSEKYKRTINDRELWTIYALPIQEKIAIDGKLDEDVWKKAEPVWLLPRRAEIAEVHTRVRMLADRENYYVGFECDEPYTDKMMCSNRSFDNPEIWRDNLVELFFASKRQDNFYYQFMLNSAGAFCDLRQENRNQNVKWNSELEYKCSVTPGKMWTVEVRIPRRSMPELKGSCFIANFTRGRRLKPECGVRTSSYSWTKYLSRFSAEEGGTVVIGTVPESKSVIIGGDFDFPVSGNRMRKGKNLAWISSCPITVDEQIFMTKGQSIRLDAKNGRVILRQPIKMQLLNAGTRYGLSFYVKLKNVTSLNGKQGFTAAIRFGNNGPGRTFYPLKHPLSGNLDWTRYQCEFTIPAGFGEKGNPYLGFYLPLGVTGKVWLDHVEIIPIKSK